MGKNKKPPKANAPISKAIPSLRLPISTQNDHPHFSFEHLRHGFCISDCDTEEKAALADRLREMSQLTWAQIQGAPRHGQGNETIDRTSIKGDAIPSCIPSDTKLIAFRFSGKKAMVGFREDRVFSVVWLDREFKLYDH